MSETPTPSPEAFVPIDRGVRLVLGACQPLPPIQVRVEDSVGRVLAEDLHAQWDLPSAPLSVMDGYAIRADDVSTSLTLTDEAGNSTTVRVVIRSGERTARSVSLR